MGWHGEPPPFYPSSSHTALDRSMRSEVLTRLYLTNYKGAEDVAGLEQLGITHVAAIGDEFIDDAPSGGIKFLRCNISDDDENRDLMASLLRDVASFIHSALKTKKGAVLVHCAAGISRSVTVVLGYMLLHRDMTLYDAFALVHKSRPCIWPNDGFMSALIELEHAVRGQRTIDLDQYVHWGDYDGPSLCEPPLSWLKRAGTSSSAASCDQSHVEPLADVQPKASLGLSKVARAAAARSASDDAIQSRHSMNGLRAASSDAVPPS